MSFGCALAIVESKLPAREQVPALPGATSYKASVSCGAARLWPVFSAYKDTPSGRALYQAETGVRRTKGAGPSDP